MAARIILFAFVFTAYVNGQLYDRLYHRLMMMAPPPTIPMVSASAPVNVSLGFNLLQILDMNPEKGYIDTLMWLNTQWTDQRFSWQMTSYPVRDIRLPTDKMWIPDIVLYNGIKTEQTMDVKAIVSYNGNIMLFTSTVYRSSCVAANDEDDAEGDVVCNLKFGSWTFDGLKLDLQLRSENVDLSNYVVNADWELVEASAVRNILYYACCPEPYVDVVVSLRLRRRTSG